MDIKTILLFRKLLNLDSKALPDSISLEDFNKLIEKSSGKLFIKPEDFKNLQKSLSQKDVELKKLQEEFEKSKKTKNNELSESEKAMASLQEKIDNMSKTIEEMNVARRNEMLEKTYPDIMPELLIGKSDKEIKTLVEKQREKNKKLYGDSDYFTPPDFSSEADVDEAIDKVKQDKNLSSEQAAVSVLQLERQKGALKTNE